MTSTSTAQPAASRQWNGDGGLPYSPLKRVLHQYRMEENTAAETTTTTTNHSAVIPGPAPTSSTATSTASTCRKPSTTAGMSFEEFVLGMLSKVGGGKAITAATQSYLRQSSSVASNRGGGGGGSVGTATEGQTTGVDVLQTHSESVQRPPRYDDRTSSYQTYRHELTADQYAVSSYHAGSTNMAPGSGSGLPYAAPHPLSDLRLIAPPAPLRRPTAPLRTDDRDEAYRERRRKNNEAAKRSRDTRRLKELQVAAQAERLAEENLQLKAEIAVLRSQLGYLHRMMLDNNNGSHLTNGSVNGTDETPPRYDELQSCSPEDAV